MVVLFASNNASALELEKIVNPVLAKAVALRCAKQVDVNAQEQKFLKGICTEYANKMVLDLDVRKDFDSGGIVFAQTQFYSLIQRPWVSEYLREVEGVISFLNPSTDTGFDLFGFTEKFLVRKGEPKGLASMVLLTLFQDNEYKIGRSHQFLHWIYLSRVTPDRTSSENIRRLRSILMMLSTHDSKSKLRKVSAYPPEVGNLTKQFNGKFYYYYLPWYLATRLNDLAIRQNNSDSILSRRLIRIRVAKTLPVILSMLFKYAHGYNSYSKAILRSFRPTAALSGDLLLVEPGWDYRYRDLYMAYVGASMAVGESWIVHFEVFRQTLGLEPNRAIQLVSQTAH